MSFLLRYGLDTGDIAENRLSHDLIEIFLVDLVIEETEDLDARPGHLLDFPDDVHPEVAGPGDNGPADILPWERMMLSILRATTWTANSSRGVVVDQIMKTTRE